MIRLIVSDLRREPGTFVAIFLCTVIVSAWVALAVIFWTSVNSASGQLALVDGPEGSGAVLTQITVFMLIIGILIPSGFVVASLGSIRVESRRVRLAQWRLAGASPSGVIIAVVSQLFLTSILAACVGFVIASASSAAWISFVLQVTDIGVPLDPVIGFDSLASSIGFTSAVTAVGALVPARRAAAVPPIEALREPRVVQRRLGPVRWLFLAVSLVLAFLFASSLLDAKFNGAASAFALLFGCATLVAIALISPVLIPVAARLWTLIGPRRSPAWFLARRQISSRGALAASVITPFLLAAGLFGVYFSAAATWIASSGGEGDDLNLIQTQGVVLFVPAAFIALAASTLALFMVARDRRREIALLRAVGATAVTLRLQPVLEAAILAITALFLALLPTVATSLLYAFSLGSHGYISEPRIDLRPAVLIVLIAFIGLSAAFALSTNKALRSSVAQVLANE